MSYPKPKSTESITILPTNNGFSVQPEMKAHECSPISDINVFNRFEDLVLFLEELYFPKDSNKKSKGPGIG